MGSVMNGAMIAVWQDHSIMPCLIEIDCGGELGILLLMLAARNNDIRTLISLYFVASLGLSLVVYVFLAVQSHPVANPNRQNNP